MEVVEVEEDGFIALPLALALALPLPDEVELALPVVEATLPVCVV